MAIRRFQLLPFMALLLTVLTLATTASAQSGMHTVFTDGGRIQVNLSPDGTFTAGSINGTYGPKEPPRPDCVNNGGTDFAWSFTHPDRTTVNGCTCFFPLGPGGLFGVLTDSEGTVVGLSVGPK